MFSFQPIGDSWLLVAALLAAMVVALFVSRVKSELSPRRRRLERALRLGVVALFAILFARPSLVTVEEEELPATYSFLIDASQSMSLRDEEGGSSRYERLREIFQSNKDAFRELCDKLDVRVFAFGESLEELDVEDGEILFPEDSTGAETKLGDALSDAKRATLGGRSLGIAVISDGSQRVKIAEEALSPRDVALELRDAEIPVAVVPFGSEDPSATVRDVSIRDLRANDRLFLGNELTVSGTVRLLGCKGLNVPISLSLESESGEMKVVDETTLAPTSDDETVPYQFVCRPETAGVWKLATSAAIQENETVETNNELGAFVEVLDRGIDVLYIEGARRIEQNFLRATLESSSDVRIRYLRPSAASLVAKSPNKTEAEMLAELAKSRKSWEKTLLADGAFATIILGDVDATAFQPNELKAIASAVENGAGLIVLAGERALALGGYAATPLADVLPIRLSESERLPLATFAASTPEEKRAKIEGAFLAAPAANKGRDEFVAQLSFDPKKNAALWAALPPLTSIYRASDLKPGARVPLVARPLDANGRPIPKKDPLPLLATQTYGSGRVAVLATDSTWRWRMRGKGEESEKFWRQLILWSAKMDGALEGELALEIDRSRFALDEPVEMRATYRPKPGEDVSETKVRAKIFAPDGSEERVDFTEEDGAWRGLAKETSTPGDYVVEAELLSASGEVLRTAKARFLAFERNVELERPEANRAELENLAIATDGQTVEPDRFGELLEELLEKRATIVDAREVKKSLYDTWPIFLAFVALLTIDWILRKRWRTEG